MTPEEIARRALFLSQEGMDGDAWWAYRLTANENAIVIDCLAKAIQSAILAEREACAKICDDERLALFKSRKPGDDASVYKVRAWQIGDIAAAIRARSNAPETEKEIIVQMSPKSRQAVIISPAPELPNKAVEPGFDDQMTVEREVYLKTCT